MRTYNPGNSEANISGWFLTDNRSNPKKYVLPAGTRIAANGYLTVSALDFGASPASGFGLSSLGEEVYLFSADGANLTGYSDGFVFYGSESGVTYGRYLIPSTGQIDHPVQNVPSVGSANGEPKIGPVVFTEIMFHPPDVFLNKSYWDNQEHEFIELRNISALPVDLFDPAFPTNTWHLRGAVRMDLPQGISLAANEALVIVSFDPTAQPTLLSQFKAKYGLDGSVRVLGPYQGKLDNSAESLRMLRPGVPLDVFSLNAGEVPYILVDRVDYSTILAAVNSADGAGPSLQKRDARAYGNDAAHWVAAAPTPGGTSASVLAPTLTQLPQSQSVSSGQPATFARAATGGAPLIYQWLHDGVAIEGANQPSIVLSSAQPGDAGAYRLVVYNSSGSASSADALLKVNLAPSVASFAAPLLARPGERTELTLSAAGDGTLGYQWMRNGLEISGATQPILVIENPQPQPDGNATNALYSLRVRSEYGEAISAVAPLLVFERPVIIGPPSPLTVLAGETAMFSIQTTGSFPMNYRWRRNLSNTTNYYANANSSLFVISNVQVAQAGPYSVLITNIFKDPVTSATFSLVVLADADKDGMADVWEVANGFDPSNAADGGSDSDGDGIKNRDEYVAGTNPKDRTSYLRLKLEPSADFFTLSFDAAADRTFSLQFLEAVGSFGWQTLASYPTSSVARVIQYTNLLPAEASRLYRVVAPQAVPARVFGPLLLTSPKSLRVALGHSFQLNALGSSLSEVKYQWLKSGVVIPGATSPTLKVGSASTGDAGLYQIILKDSQSSVTSPTAEVTVF